MITIDMTGKNVLITGGTKGIGLGTAFAFAEAGAQLFLTYKWGSADLEQIREKLRKLGGPEPVFLEADASRPEDTVAAMEEIDKSVKSLDVFISNVGIASKPGSLDDYKKSSFYKSLDYSTWPLIDYCQKAKRQFGTYPRYVLATSSNGPDCYYPGYDFVAASKAALESLGRYLSVHLQKEGSSFNVVRFGPVKTESFGMIFGDGFFDFAKANGIEHDLTIEDCGKVLLGLCSGLFDIMNGQVLQVDHGLSFQDNIMRYYLESNSIK